MAKQSNKPDSDGSPLPGPGAGFTFLYYFSMSIVIVMIAGSQGRRLSIGSADLYRYGILFGLLAGGIGTYFNRTASLEISLRDSPQLKAQLESVLAELGYELDANATEQQEDYTVYRRSGLAKVFSGTVFVNHHQKETQIVSRVSTLRKLQRQL